MWREGDEGLERVIEEKRRKPGSRQGTKVSERTEFENVRQKCWEKETSSYSRQFRAGWSGLCWTSVSQFGQFLSPFFQILVFCHSPLHPIQTRKVYPFCCQDAGEFNIPGRKSCHLWYQAA